MEVEMPMSFTIISNAGPHEINCDFFWIAYQHCKEVHPELEPIKSAIEHVLGMEIANDLPETIMEGCKEIIKAYEDNPEAQPKIVTFIMGEDQEEDDSPATEEELENWKPKGYMQ